MSEAENNIHEDSQQALQPYVGLIGLYKMHEEAKVLVIVYLLQSTSQMVHTSCIDVWYVRKLLELHIISKYKESTMLTDIYLGFIFYRKKNIGQEGIRSQRAVEGNDTSHERPEDH